MGMGKGFLPGLAGLSRMTIPKYLMPRYGHRRFITTGKTAGLSVRKKPRLSMRPTLG